MSKQETKNCQNCKNSFTIEPEDFQFYEKMQVPAPTFCPECRAQRRFIFRNDHFLYKRKSDFSGETIFSAFSSNVLAKVYENNIYYSDKWDPFNYGREVDFSRPFLEQLLELSREIPRPARFCVDLINSDYSNNATGLKNCYLVFNANYCEDSQYCNGVDYCRDCFDNSHSKQCELCYQCFWLDNCHRAFFSSYCEESSDIYFSKNLRGCDHCFGCVNLRNKRYYIFNKPYSKAEYFVRLKEFNTDSYKSLRKTIKGASDFWLKFPNKFIDGISNLNVTGSYVTNSKNVLNSYLIREGENLRYCQYLQTPPNKNCYDYSIWGNNSQFVYECINCGLGTNNIRFSVWCWPSVQDLGYCIFCGSSSNLFGCVGLRNKEYCILNKQYSAKEYCDLRSKIIEHMNKTPYKDKIGNVYKYGEFFPPDFCPYGYNETIAQEHFPLTKEVATRQGYRWSDQGDRNYNITTFSSDLPDHINDIDDAILREIVGCEHGGNCNDECTTAFKITPSEFQFYKKMNLPLPRFCPNCRYVQRLSQRNSFKLWRRECHCAGQKSDNQVYSNTVSHFHGQAHCPNEFQTSYAPDRPEIVYCEQCYQAEVV